MKQYRFIYQKWWKLATVVLLLYVFIAGFLIPLRPGILDVTPFELYTGKSYKVDVFTYNAHFDKPGKQISAYIKFDSIHYAQASAVEVKGRNELVIEGTLPSTFPGNGDRHDATLIVHDSQDGYLLLPFAFSIVQSSDDAGVVSEWTSSLGGYHQEWTFRFPFLAVLYETIRNTFFHVAIWMAMFILLVISLVYSIRYLRSNKMTFDAIAASFTHVAVGFGITGMITGSIWAKATWGTYWTDDPKLNMSAVAMMIYLAYSILRASLNDADKRAKVSAAYNIFAFVAMIPLLFIIPRMTDGLHPGNGGNPALGGEDLDSTLRLIFYPAIIAYTLLGIWMSSLLFRIRNIELKQINNQLKS